MSKLRQLFRVTVQMDTGIPLYAVFDKIKGPASNHREVNANVYTVLYIPQRLFRSHRLLFIGSTIGRRFYGMRP